MASASFTSSLHAHLVVALRDALNIKTREAKAMLAAPIGPLFAAAKANLDKDRPLWVFFRGQRKELAAVDAVFGQTIFADPDGLRLHEDQRLCR